MKQTETILQTEQFVRKHLANEGTGHDWCHAVRVVNIGKAIHAAEGGDWYVIQLALLLHDVGDRKVIGQDEDDYSIARTLLDSIGVKASVIDDVIGIISTMSFSKSFEDSGESKSIEFKIVQDADRLDAIGAIGVARAFAFGGSRGRLLYDPTQGPETYKTADEYKKATGSTLHHFYEKLFLLKDGLNTATATSMAHERDTFMHTFVDQFLDEWNGKR